MSQGRSGITALATYKWLVLHLLSALNKVGLKGEGRVKSLDQFLKYTPRITCTWITQGLVKISVTKSLFGTKGLCG